MLRCILSTVIPLCFFACGEKHAGSQKEALLTPTKTMRSIVSTKTVQVSNASNDLDQRKVKKQCCIQCASAAGMDPTGADISMKACSAYSGMMVNGAALLSDTCIDFFDESKLNVMDCR